MNLKRLIQFLLLLVIPSTSYIYVQSVGSLTDEANLVITLSLTILFPVLFWLFLKGKSFLFFQDFLLVSYWPSLLSHLLKDNIFITY